MSASAYGGLSENHNKELKNLFKSAAVSASTRPGSFLQMRPLVAGARQIPQAGEGPAPFTPAETWKTAFFQCGGPAY